DDLESKLRNFSLSEAENSIVDLAQEDIKLSKEECIRSLFGKIIGDRKASLFGLKRTMTQIWKIQHSVEIRELRTNFFQFIFESREDLKKVASGTNWIYDNQYLILQEWQDNISSTHTSFDILHLWVHVYNVPFHWQSAEVGLKIGRLFKGVKNVTLSTAGDNGAGRVIRILAAINIKEPLLRCANVRLGNKTIKVSFKYEKLVNLCYYCGKLGHLDRDCTKRIEDIAQNSLQEGQFGEWLKAGDNTITYPFQQHSTSGSSMARSSEHAPKSISPPINQAFDQNHRDTSTADNLFNLNSLVEVTVHSHPEQQRVATQNTLSNKQALPLLPMDTSVQSKEAKTIASTDMIPSEQLHDSPTNMETEKNVDDIGKANKEPAIKKWKRVAQNRDKAQRTLTINEPAPHIIWKVVNPTGTAGGLLLLWSKDVLISQIICHNFCMEVEYYTPFTNKSSWIIFVYMSTAKNTREHQWDLLKGMQQKWGSSWLCAGDWNDICNPVEKRGGLPRTPTSCLGFNSFISDLGMIELKWVGYNYTWANNREHEGFVEEKLDRAFCSIDWLTEHPNATVENILRSSSDHSMLLINTNATPQQMKSRFSFDKRWISKEGVNDVIAKAWNQPCEGTPMYRVKEKIKATRIALIHWSRNHHSENQKKIQTLTSALEELRTAGGERDWNSWNSIKNQLDAAYYQEEVYWKQKSRMLWLKAGDKNTKFFHAFTAQRRRLNAITRLFDENGNLIDDHQSIKNCICRYYENLYSSEGPAGNLEILSNIPQTITDQQNEELIAESTIFFSKNSPQQLKRSICYILNNITEHTSTKYLGLPLGIGKSKAQAFSF
ncbi:Unknown protein, partial [Striga hermonthica]